MAAVSKNLSGSYSPMILTSSVMPRSRLWQEYFSCTMDSPWEVEMEEQGSKTEQIIKGKKSKLKINFLYRSRQKKLDLAEWLKRLSANAKVATVLGSIPASSDTVDSEGRQTKHRWINYRAKNSPWKKLSMKNRLGEKNAQKKMQRPS